MILQPANATELAQLLSTAAPNNIERVDLSALSRIVQYTPEDMVVTVKAGTTLAALQTELAQNRQWLPIDPPHATNVTLAEIINANLSGPRRFGFGTIRDHLIGITVMLADGTVIHSGGKVVKNVAGYDLAKLFIGSHASLGITIEATFKLRPLPELEQFVEASCTSLEQADQLIEAVIKSPVTPVVLDLHNSNPGQFTTVLSFAGTREEVEWQLAQVVTLGFNQPSSLDYHEKFWAAASPHGVPPSGGPSSVTHSLSVLPSKLVDALRALNNAPFIAHAGNGLIHHRGQPTPHQDKLPLDLMRRLKDAYDPRHILPELPL